MESARLRGAECVRPTLGRFDEDVGEKARESGVLIVGRGCAGEGGIWLGEGRGCKGAEWIYMDRLDARATCRIGDDAVGVVVHAAMCSARQGRGEVESSGCKGSSRIGNVKEGVSMSAASFLPIFEVAWGVGCNVYSSRRAREFEVIQ